MSTRSFSSLFMVASCAGAALGCYLVSLRVASERAALEDVENRIVLTQRDVRVIQTEIGTRGRLSQLERWNAGAFSLSAPGASQILEGSVELARLVQPERPVDFQAPVVLASAPAPPPNIPLEQPQASDSGVQPALTPGAMLHQASLKTETREVPARTVVAQAEPAAMKSVDKPVTAAKPAQSKSADKPGLAAAQMKPTKSAARPAAVHMADASKPQPKKSVDKPALGAAKPMTKRVELAKTDPLAPLPVRHSGRTKDSPTGR
jgi:hypothetical protein